MMSVKFRLGFTVEAETMFSLMAKLLPIEDLSVEELREPPRRVSFSPNTFAAPKLAKPKRASPPIRPYAINLKKGMNAIVLQLMSDGEPHRFREIGEALKAANFSGNGVGNLLKRLIKYNLIEQNGEGVYRAAKQ
jgi:hypothetical protein